MLKRAHVLQYLVALSGSEYLNNIPVQDFLNLSLYI